MTGKKVTRILLFFTKSRPAQDLVCKVPMLNCSMFAPISPVVRTVSHRASVYPIKRVPKD